MATRKTGSTGPAAGSKTAEKGVTRKRSTALPGKAGKTKGVAPGQRHHMIAEAAYYLAEQRGFNGGDADQDWLTAETEIDRRLGAPG